MINKKQILWGVTDSEDKLFLSKMCDIAARSINTGMTMFSRFLNPGQRLMLEGRFSDETEISYFGGYDGADRTVAAFGGNPNNDEFPICALKITAKNKAVYSHRDYLGSLLSLGITRELLGDIVINGEYAVLFCTADISEFITMNLSRVASATVKLEYIEDLSELNIKRQFKESSLTVSSMRFDCVLSTVCGKSRSETAALIGQGLACINHSPSKNTSARINSGDVLSLRGFGKFTVETDNSVTRKGRIHINVKKYI